MQKKTIVSIIIVVLTCVLLIAACIYLFPIKSTSLNATMEATKLDSDGNVLGTTEISMQGAYKNYLFRESLMELAASPFGGLKSIKFGDSDDRYGFAPAYFDDFYCIIGSAWDDITGDLVFVSVSMSQNFEYWVFRADYHDQPVYYVASTSEHTVEEIVQFFKGLAPGYKAP